jgi:hypothetical protein
MADDEIQVFQVLFRQRGQGKLAFREIHPFFRPQFLPLGPRAEDAQQCPLGIRLLDAGGDAPLIDEDGLPFPQEIEHLRRQTGNMGEGQSLTSGVRRHRLAGQWRPREIQIIPRVQADFHGRRSDGTTRRLPLLLAARPLPAEDDPRREIKPLLAVGEHFEFRQTHTHRKPPAAPPRIGEVDALPGLNRPLKNPSPARPMAATI